MSQLPDGMELGLVNSTNIRITDDDSKKTRLCNTNKSLVVFNTAIGVVFYEESYHVNEGSGAVSVCVRREGEADESFIISVATSDSSPVQAEGIVNNTLFIAVANG